jgi:hypothetical protein
MKKLKAAKERVIISPPVGTPMAGNIRLDNRSRGVHDDLYCNILILNDNSVKVCLLGFDLIGIEYATCTDIKERIEKVTGIPSENIVMWATHTHSGPDTGMRMYQGVDEIINAYLVDLTLKVVEGVVRANNKYESVILRAGKTSVSDLSFNRRLIKNDGSVVMNFEKFERTEITGTTGPVDDELITLSLWNNNGKLFAVLVNFTLHPAILVSYKWLISRDFINYLDEYLKENYGDQVITLFANGAEGNINHLNYLDPDQLRSFEETERIGKKLGSYVSTSFSNSTVLDGRIRFVSEKVTLPLRRITEEENRWADMVLERDKNLTEEMFDGIPDKTYAKMIKGMLVRTDKKCETVLQGMAIHNFSFVTFPGEVYVEFGLKAKKLSPYSYTMVIGLANSQVGYIPEKDAFSQGGYEVRTAWTSQLAHDAGDILVNLVKEKVLDNLLLQSVRVMERKASDNKYLHKDFHIALNLLMTYILENFGSEALKDYLKQFSGAYFSPLKQKLMAGDKDALVSYFRDIYEKEEWPVRIETVDNRVEICQDSCPAMSYILAIGAKPCLHYRETYNTVYTSLCENTPYEYMLEYFDDATGACRQFFSLKKDNK